MGFMGIALLAALVLVIATRGSLRQLGRLPVEGYAMLLAALVLQAVVELVNFPRARVDDVGFGLLLLSYALLLSFCFANLRNRGVAIVAIGISLNALVIALNQGMPADGPTRIDARGRRVSSITTSVKHRPERPGDVLTVLDDHIRLPEPFHEILSFGDLVLVAGLLDVCYWGSRRDERAWRSIFASSSPALAGTDGDLPVVTAPAAAASASDTGPPVPERQTSAGWRRRRSRTRSSAASTSVS
jgi:hypothetical protein